MRTFLFALLTMFPSTALAVTTDHSINALEALVENHSGSSSREGVATYYASRFEGRRTSSGERYNPYLMTAAHATLPLGTVVSVEELNSSRSVIVRINDRCHPRHASRNLIDLSRIAAGQIGLWGKGVKKVMISQLIGWGSEDETILRELAE